MTMHGTVPRFLIKTEYYQVLNDYKVAVIYKKICTAGLRTLYKIFGLVINYKESVSVAFNTLLTSIGSGRTCFPKMLSEGSFIPRKKKYQENDRKFKKSNIFICRQKANWPKTMRFFEGKRFNPKCVVLSS